MNCDRLLSNLETGGPLRRMTARLHALRCPQCRAARKAFAQAKRELAVAAPLSDQQRELWLKAIRGAAEPRRRRVGIALAVTVAAALLIVALALLPKQRKPDAGRIAELPAVATSVNELDTAAALSRLEQDVALLQSELDRLDQEAELLDARQRVTQMLDQYSEW